MHSELVCFGSPGLEASVWWVYELDRKGSLGNCALSLFFHTRVPLIEVDKVFFLLGGWGKGEIPGLIVPHAQL